MPYYQKTIFSGDVCEVEIYFSPRTAGKRIPRRPKEHLTTAQQAEQNLRRARKELARKINTNFTRGDLFLTLTYAKEPKFEEAANLLTKFLRYLRDYCRRKQITFKYIYVTEDQDKRLHHHIVMSSLPADLVMEAWKHGRVLISRLTPDGDYTGLANYITKDSITKDGKLNRKRWNSSRNLDKPRVERIEIKKSRKAPLLPEPPKGYQLKEQYYHFSEATGMAQYMKAVRIGGCDYSEGGNAL